MSLPRVTLHVPPLHNAPQNWPIHATYPEDTVGESWVDDPLYGRAAIVQDYMTENDPSYGVFHPWNGPALGSLGRYETLAEAVAALRAAGYEINTGAPYLPDVRIGVDSWGDTVAYFDNGPEETDDLAAWDAPGGARVCRPSPDDEGLDARVDRSVPLIMEVENFEAALQVLRDRGHRVLDGGGK